MKELGQLDDIYHLTAIPPHSETRRSDVVDQCRIYKNADQPGLVDNILIQHDFQPLSISFARDCRTPEQVATYNGMGKPETEPVGDDARQEPR